MDPLMLEAMIRTHLQARAEQEASRMRRRRPRRGIVGRVFYTHRPPTR